MTKYVNNNGVSEMWLNIKNWVTSQLLGKQDTLVSGTNIKTVNNQSLLGSGNISFTPPTTIDTDDNGNMTFNGHIVDTIEEQGNEYIRYSNGIQICWGTLTWQADCTFNWGSLYSSTSTCGSYAKSFVARPSFSAGLQDGGNGYRAIISSYQTGSATSTPRFTLVRPDKINSIMTCVVSYIAIGRWK